MLILLFVISFSGCKDRTVSNAKVVIEKITGISHLKWSREAVVYEVNLRQYTNEGTIKAFEEHLPRLKKLGVDVLCFMPVYPISKYKRKGLLGSCYAVKDHKEINPEFGTSEDFKQMVDNAHDMGFKVLLDWVAAHTGCDNAWVTEHPDWYIKDENSDFVGAHDWEDTYMLDYDNSEMCAAMMEALEFWIHKYDVDGYRCNAAQEIPINFWENARERLDSIKPVFMLAEAEHPELLANAFDMCYN